MRFTKLSVLALALSASCLAQGPIGRGIISVGISNPVPTFVQGVDCPASGAFGVGGASDYKCQLAELTLANNLVLLHLIYDNTTAPTVTVTTRDASGTTIDTMTQIITNTTANGNVQRMYKVATAGAAKYFQVHFSSTTGFVGMTGDEYYNATTTASGTALCTRVSSTTVATGNITVASGGLLVQQMFPDDTTASGALTVGSGFTFSNTVRNDSEATQYRLGTGSAINPTITQGTSHPTATCAAGFTASAVGTAPTLTPRVLRLSHAGMPTGAANPFVLQVPMMGDTGIIVAHSGGNTITSISAADTWTCTSASTMGANTSHICYAHIASPSNTYTISITRSATTSDYTFMTYDVTGLATSPFDTSQNVTGNNATQGSSFTTCSSCLTPTTANGLIFSTAGWDFCTATNATAPSGNLFDSATFTAFGVDGPQPIDQNNGWLMYRNPNTSAVSTTWTMNCTGSAGSSIGDWSGTVASFKAP